MEILKSSIALGLLLAASSCGPINSVTETIPLDTDTYISTSDSSNHAELDHLDISKSASLEERTITKLPTTDKDSSDVTSQTLEDFFVTLFFFPLEIISDLLQCEAEITQPANLTSAELIFNVASNSGGGALDGEIQLLTLSKPWYQTVNWTRAHPFSGRGLWTSPGGDIDSTFTAVPAVTVSGTSNGEIEFDITSYFKNLISAGGQGVHYGFLLESAGATLSPVTLRSTQYTLIDERPRLVSTYVGTCASDHAFRLRRRTTVLGKDHRVLDEILN